MSKATQQWQRLLFYQHHLVAISPLNRDLQLLDVLVKKGSHGLPFIGDRGPKIVRIGSVLSLRSHDDNPDWEEWAKHAKDRLWRLQQNEDLVENDELFSTGSIGDYEANTEFASIIHLALSSFVGTGGNRAKSWSGSALNVTYAKFTEDSEENLFYANPVALWKPDLQRIMLEQPSLRSDGTLDLWVVKEIQYAKEIKISASSDFGAHGGVDLASVAGIPISLPGGTLQVGAKVGKAKDEATEHVKGQKVPFAFKAIRLVYRENGHLIAKHSDLGTRRVQFAILPSTFFDADYDMGVEEGDEEEDSDEEEDIQLLDGIVGVEEGDEEEDSDEEEDMQLLDRIVGPSTFFDVDYHMGGLFAQLAPVEEGDEEEDMQLLDVVTNDENEGVQMLEVEPTKAQ